MTSFPITDIQAEAFEGHLGWTLHSSPFNIDLITQRKRPSYEEDEEKKIEYELIQGSANLRDPESIYLGNHSFVNGCVIAYSKHHNLVIRPDDVWVSIMTQFSTYVTKNAEALRDRFVDFKDKKELVVFGGGSLHTAEYAVLCKMLEEQIANNIKDPSIKEWVVPDFSTTTATDRVVGSVLLVATMKNYFDYKMKLRCGLPKITLLGTIDDWKQVRFRAERLVEFDVGDKCLHKWSRMLLPVLDEFVATISGNCNEEWWSRIAYHVGGGSGPTYLSGWITVFCVFNDQGNWIGDNHTYKSRFEASETEWIFIDTNDIPKGYLSVPITVDDNGTIFKTEMYAGHIVLKLADEKTTVIPQLDWGLVLPKN